MQRAAPSTRVEVRRAPQRAVYDPEQVKAILDEGLVCHLGFVFDGAPVVIPTMYARHGDRLYVHGSPASRMLKSLSSGIDVCVTVTHLDGLVYARSAFHHSMNYRSVVVMGRGTVVTDAEEKLAALRALVERFGSGRWDEVRKPSLKEFSKTLVLAVPLGEASAKIRSGPPVDDEDDLELDVWAGVVPLGIVTESPQPDPPPRTRSRSPRPWIV